METVAYNQVIPQAGDTFIGAPGAILDGRHKNSYAFGGDASDVTIKFLTVQNFGSKGENNNEGVVNHDSAEAWTVESSTIQNNAGAGVMLGSGNRVIGNCLRNNGQYGFNAYHADGVKDIVLERQRDLRQQHRRLGAAAGRVRLHRRRQVLGDQRRKVTDNYVHDNRGVGLWADSNNVGFRFRRQLHLRQ